jgi:cysteinyl-tRNA synthetase
MRRSKATLDGLYQLLRDADEILKNGNAVPDESTVKGFVERLLIEPLFDDLNTPEAMSYLSRAQKAIRAKLETAKFGTTPLDPSVPSHARFFQDLSEEVAALRAGAKLMGFLQQSPEEWFRGPVDDVAEIDQLVAARVAARTAKNYAESDRLRDELAARGVEVMDSATGSTWRRKG